MSNTVTTEEQKKKQKDIEFITARNVYILIFATFLAVCFVAVTVTTWRESHKTGFRAIELEKPMSFFDKTYVKQDTAEPAEAQH